MVGKSISGGFSLYLFSAIVFLVTYFCFLRKRKLSIYHKIIFITLYIYLILVIEKTLMPIPVNYAQIDMWKKGFSYIQFGECYSLIPSFDFSDNLWRRNIIMNIIMFMPFGFLWPLYKGKFNSKFILIASLIFSLMIELYQLCMAFIMKAPLWYFDTNDLIANVLGGLIGYSILTCLSPYLFKNISKKEIYGGNHEENN